MPSKSRLTQENHPARTNTPAAAAEAASVGQAAGETRLTPHEAAETLAALEAARLARAEQMAGTISVNEVIEQFGLDASPEEVLTALAGNRSVPRQTSRPRALRIPRSVVLSGCFAAALCFVWLVMWPKAPVPVPVRTAANPAKSDRSTSSVGDFGNGLTVIDRSSGHSVSSLLSEVPDGHPVELSAAELSKILPFTSTLDEGTHVGRWTAERRHGRVFVNGFLPTPVSPGIAAQGHLLLANRAMRPNNTSIGTEPTQVWIPLDRLRSIDSAYSTQPRENEGDDTAYTFASGADDWSRVFVGKLAPGELQPANSPATKRQSR